MKREPDQAAPADQFPWAKAMQFGFGVMHLSSKEFWSLTLIELDCALAAHFGEAIAPMNRSVLSDLIQQFPDN